MASFKKTVCVALIGLAGFGCGDDSDTATSTTSTSSTGGSGAGGSGGASGMPIDAPNDTWTWVPFDNAVCGTGTPTGIGINPTGTKSKLVIYLQGGGVCYDQMTCLGPNPSASHFSGYGTADFDEYKVGEGLHGPFDRADAGNPFRDYSYVFVPYCTGDVHAGNNVQGDLHFVGHANLEAYLERVVPTFPALEQLVLTGTSAGGFGAMYDFYLVKTAFDPAPAVLIDDSGPFLPLSATPQLGALAVFFGLEGTLPPGCDKCLDNQIADGGLHQLIPYYATTFPGVRGSLISSLQDQTIAGNFMMTGPELETALNTLADDVVPLNPDFRVYYLTGDNHVWLFGGDQGTHIGDVTSAGVTLSTFISQEIAGDAAWMNVRP